MDSEEDRDSYVAFSKTFVKICKIPEVKVDENSNKNRPAFDFYFNVQEQTWQVYDVLSTEIPDNIPFSKIFVPNI